MSEPCSGMTIRLLSKGTHEEKGISSPHITCQHSGSVPSLPCDAASVRGYLSQARRLGSLFRSLLLAFYYDTNDI